MPGGCSNDPNEDDHSTAIVSHPNGSWSFFALFDGHSGWETSAWLRENMIPAVVGALADLYNNYHVPDDETFNSTGQESNRDSHEPPGQTVNDTIKNTFLRLDDDIVHWAVDRVFSTTSKKLATNLLAPAYAGSCALLAFYDSQTRLLRIAVTGDSRAVLGRRALDENGKLKYEVHVLSVDQDGNNPLEIERLNNSPEHPGEEVIKNGRVLGMGPSRAFGDARWKWSEATQNRLKKEYLGRSKPGDVKTPPYLTAEPVVTTTTVEKGDHGRPDRILCFANAFAIHSNY
jgi:pyruvate dehydrogenase phosphatase